MLRRFRLCFILAQAWATALHLALRAQETFFLVSERSLHLDFTFPLLEQCYCFLFSISFMHLSRYLCFQLLLAGALCHWDVLGSFQKFFLGKSEEVFKVSWQCQSLLPLFFIHSSNIWSSSSYVNSTPLDYNLNL